MPPPTTLAVRTIHDVDDGEDETVTRKRELPTDALARLAHERKAFRGKHPHGFYARPRTRPDGSADLREWECGVPGKVGTPWAGGVFPLRMVFPDSFPAAPPKCVFEPAIFHPNVYPNGEVCSSLLVEGENWSPALSVVDILVSVQSLLEDVNPASPAQAEACLLYVNDRDAYEARVRQMVTDQQKASSSSLSSSAAGAALMGLE